MLHYSPPHSLVNVDFCCLLCEHVDWLYRHSERQIPSRVYSMDNTVEQRRARRGQRRRRRRTRRGRRGGLRLRRPLPRKSVTKPLTIPFLRGMEGVFSAAAQRAICAAHLRATEIEQDLCSIAKKTRRGRHVQARVCAAPGSSAGSWQGKANGKANVVCFRRRPTRRSEAQVAGDLFHVP